MPISETELRQQIIEAGRRLYLRGFVAANDGNISARLGNGLILTTPTGISKGFMREEDLAVTDSDGNMISGPAKPSSEIKMHLLIYRTRPDINAVVHAHPPHATGFAAAGRHLNDPIIAEPVVTLGDIPLAPYGTPGTTELTESLEPFILKNDAVLMANHGAVTYAASVEKALFMMESLEHYAAITLVTDIIGRKSFISPENMEKLRVIRQAASGASAQPGEERLAEIIADEIIKFRQEKS
ncbi:MAG: class II aldolase/adducin family protein [Elusimicrobiaceae bacterium]